MNKVDEPLSASMMCVEAAQETICRVSRARKREIVLRHSAVRNEKATREMPDTQELPGFCSCSRVVVEIRPMYFHVAADGIAQLFEA